MGPRKIGGREIKIKVEPYHKPKLTLFYALSEISQNCFEK